MESLDSIREEWLRQIASAAGADALELIRVGALGRNGRESESRHPSTGLAPLARIVPWVVRLRGPLHGKACLIQDRLDRPRLQARLEASCVEVVVRLADEGVVRQDRQAVARQALVRQPQSCESKFLRSCQP